MTRTVADHEGSPTLLRIGQLAKRVDAPADTLRYYERLGLVEPAARSEAGYRLYDPSAVERMAFIRKAQALGLSLAEVGDVLRAASDGTQPCEHVRETLELRMREVDERIDELSALRRTLARALDRSRELPVAESCVCRIIESQELPPGGPPDR